MSNQVVVYPRGFLGYDIGLPVRKEGMNQQEALTNAYLNKKSSVRDRSVISNVDVENLYKTLLQNAWIPNSFVFREKIMIAALQAFGTKSFFDWCELQRESAYFTDLHRRFLNDTFQFITTGTRKQTLHTWLALIGQKHATTRDNNTHYGYREFFKMEQASLLRRSFSLTDVVAGWCSQPGGVEDMITTLHILFGDIDTKG